MKKIIKAIIMVCGLIGLFFGVSAFTTTVKADFYVHVIASSYSPDIMLTVSGSSEENSLINSGVWHYEGIGFWEFSSAPSKVPVYRLFNSAQNRHMFTTDVNERNGLALAGWHYEGIPFYTGGSSPVYRLFYNSLNSHLWSLNNFPYSWSRPGDSIYTGSAGYCYNEGIAFYAQ